MDTISSRISIPINILLINVLLYYEILFKTKAKADKPINETIVSKYNVTVNSKLIIFMWLLKCFNRFMMVFTAH